MKRLRVAFGIFLLASTINASNVTATPITPTLILLPNGVQGTILATNNPGDVVGTFVPPGLPFPEFLGFEIDHHGVFTEIGPSFPPLTLGIRHAAIAIDINNNGDIVGLWRGFHSGEPSIFQSFLFEKDVYTNIEIDHTSFAQPHCIDHDTTVTSIENNGDVFGNFRVGALVGPCGFPTIFGSFVWRNGLFSLDAQKIPEPSSWWLLGLGLMGVARVGRRIA